MNTWVRLGDFGGLGKGFGGVWRGLEGFGALRGFGGLKGFVGLCRVERVWRVEGVWRGLEG